MAIVVDTASATTATDVTVNGYVDLAYPAGTVEGDVLVVLAGNDSQTATAQFDDVTYKPDGFTWLTSGGDTASDTACAAFVRVADGTESGTCHFPAASTVDLWAVMVRCTGVDTTDPVDVIGAVTLAASSSSHTASSVTTTVDGCVVFCPLSFDGGDGIPFTQPTGFTKGSDVQAGTGAGNCSGTWSFIEQGTAGATGAAVTGSNVADGSSTFLFALKPAAGGGSTFAAAGSSTSVSTGAGSPSVVRRVRGAAGPVSSLSGTVRALLRAVGRSVASTTTTGSPRAVLRAAGASAASGSTSGSPRAVLRAAGALLASTSTSGSASSVARVAGTSAAVADTAGSPELVSTLPQLYGSVAATSAGKGSPRLRSVLHGASSAESVLHGRVSLIARVRGTIPATSQGTGTPSKVLVLIGRLHTATVPAEDRTHTVAGARRHTVDPDTRRTEVTP